MHHLSGFWHGAASLTGRIDLSEAVYRIPKTIEQSNAVTLSALGISKAHIRRLHTSQSIPTSFQTYTLDNPSYPGSLAPLAFAPPVLFMAGQAQLLEEPLRIAVVGSRRCTENGRQIARELAQGIAHGNGVVVSGLANGIDTAAHLAALDRTIAVLGSGLNKISSRHQRRTAQRIIEAGGLVISEFLPSIPASKYTFPQRNRIIAGLCQGTIVVEAALRSGARITARHALDAGREVFAVPGSPLAPMSAGCLELLMQGAGLTRNIADVWASLGIEPDQSTAKRHPIIEAMDGKTLPFNDLVQLCGLPPVTLMRALSMLELTGRIVRLPGDRYAQK